MKSIVKDSQKLIRNFFEKTGILFPKGKRSATDRRSGRENRSIVIDNYMVVGGAEKRTGVARRQNIQRRKTVPV
jgi:hypothetical protein